MKCSVYAGLAFCPDRISGINVTLEICEDIEEMNKGFFLTLKVKSDYSPFSLKRSI